MARSGPFTLSRLFVNFLLLMSATIFLSVQPATVPNCYARQFIAFKEVTRNSETFVMELVVKDVGSCIKMCCEQREKGGCDSVSFDHDSSNCSLFRCSAFVACLPMTVKNSVNSYLFFTIPTPATTLQPSFASSTSSVLAIASISPPLPTLTCPHNNVDGYAAPAGEFIREVLLHDASACLSFCCRHSRETGCRSVSFRTESFRCALFRCADERECPPMTTTDVVSYSTAKEQFDKLVSSRGTTIALSTQFFQNSDTTTSTVSAVENGFEDSPTISPPNERSSTKASTTTTERASSFLNEGGSTGQTAVEMGQTDDFESYSTTSDAPSSMPDSLSSTTITTITTTTTIADSVLSTDTVSLTAAEVEKLDEQSVGNGSAKRTATAQTEVALASTTTTSATASADSGEWETAPFTKDGLLAAGQITSRRATGVIEAAATKNTDALITHSSSEFDQPTEASFDQSSSLHALGALTTATSPPQPSIPILPFDTEASFDQSSSLHALGALTTATSPPQPSIPILPFETIDRQEATSASAASDGASSAVTRLVERTQIFTSPDEAAISRSTASTSTAQLNTDTATRTADGQQFDQGFESPQNHQQSGSSSFEISGPTTVTSNTDSIIDHFTIAVTNKEETPPPIVNSVAFSTQHVENELPSTDAIELQRTTLTNRVSPPQHTVTAPLTTLIETVIAATRSKANDNDEATHFQSSTVGGVEYDYKQDKVDVSMDSNNSRNAVHVPIWILSIGLAILIALLTIMILIGLHMLRRLTVQSGEYNVLKALSSRKL
uniref:Apple domain-containing protein n=1 Tax=Plectus sambesii TaxID=2011161 RepID=A0A914XIF2_9BILA